MNKEENLKMAIPEIEPLQKKQQDEQPPVYQPCTEVKTVNVVDMKLQVSLKKSIIAEFRGKHSHRAKV